MSEYRALTIFEDLPVGHKAVLVRQSGFEPHLKLGEFAVVDITDKNVEKDELYVIWIRSGINGPELAIVQASLRPYENFDGKFIGVGWRYAFKRPGSMPFGEGPYLLEAWPEKCFGRVVGVFEPLMTHLDTCGLSLPESILLPTVRPQTKERGNAQISRSPNEGMESNARSGKPPRRRATGAR